MRDVEFQDKKAKILFESVNDAIFILDLKGNFLDVNKTAYERLGYTKEEMLSINISELDPPEFAAKVPERIEQVMKNGSAIFESAHVRKDGTVMPVEINTKIVEYEGKKVFLSVVRDITERIQTEGLLKKSEERYRNLVETTNDWVWEINEHAVYTYASPQIRDILGYEPEEVIGKTPFDFMPPKEAKRVYDLFSSFAAKRKSFKFLENTNLHKNSHPIILETSGAPSFDPEGNFLGYRGIDRDITERKQAEEALKESEEHYRAQFEESLDGIVITDAKTGIIIDCNPAIQKLVRREKSELIGQHQLIMHPPEEKDGEFSRTFKQHLIKHRGQSLDTQIMTKDGEKRDVSIKADLLTVRDKSYLWGIFHDITERKRTEEELDRHRHHLEELVEERTDELTKSNKQLKREIIERKRAEKALRESEASLKVAQELAHIGNWSWIVETDTIQWSEELYNITGQNPQLPALTYAQLSSFYTKESWKKLNRAVEKTIQKGSSFDLELDMVRPDGQVRCTHTRGKAVKNKSGSVIFLYGTVQDITERKKAEIKFLEYQKKLRILSSELSLIEERERRLLAVELHDNIGQSLAISRIKLKEIQESGSSVDKDQSLKEILKFIEEAIQHTRSLMYELSPPVLYELGFESAVGWLVEQTEKKHGLICSLENDKCFKPLNDEVRFVLFRAVRELLVNIVKHGKTQKAKISISKEGKNIQIEIKDYGIGFNISKLTSYVDKTSGFGIFNIRERLDCLGGHFEIESEYGKGTCATLVAPLKHGEAI